MKKLNGNLKWIVSGAIALVTLTSTAVWRHVEAWSEIKNNTKTVEHLEVEHDEFETEMETSLRNFNRKMDRFGKIQLLVARELGIDTDVD